MNKDSFLEFTSDQLRTLRSASRDIYYLLKPIFERQGTGIVKPYTSVSDYKVKKELKFKLPSHFYCFRRDDVIIEIVIRRGLVYSVGCFGFQPSSNYPTLSKLFIKDDFLSVSEKDFSNGYFFYGRFNRQHFTDCIDLWQKIVMQFILQDYGIKLDSIYKQMEFIF